ncbi:MAG TPA: Flp family type IVb pilin [Chloroflexota bacterium]|jgi:pilus assembly protein Flp/PilA|nr:Flp family type IVb pilin [Chloroflexota bacterium]
MGQLRAWWGILQTQLAEYESGQGMVEYGLILAAVAVVVLVALFALGPKIASLFSQTAASLQ